MSLFKDRCEAGRALAQALKCYADRDDVVVLALPRGGVPVAFEVAKALHLPLDVLIVRKLGCPAQKELAMGAMASGGIRVINKAIINQLNISQDAIDAVVAEEQQEMERREHTYRGKRALLDVHDKIVILVDDGIATGATMRAAVQALKQRKPINVVVASPTGASDTVAALQGEADNVVCLATPEPYIAVGYWYQLFPQTNDNEVKDLLAQANARSDARPAYQ